MRPLRVIDTGIRGGREKVAFDQALIEARNAGRVPETLRFLRFRPCTLGIVKSIRPRSGDGLPGRCYRAIA